MGNRLDFAPRASAAVHSSGDAGSNPGWVYVLDPHVTVDGRRVVKIGYTRQSVEARVRQLSTGAVGGISIVHRMHVDAPRAVEARLHAKFASRRLSRGHGREFFAVDPEEVVREMDAIGAEVSSRIADERHAEALTAFRKAHGITNAQARVDTLLFLLGTALVLGTAGLAVVLYLRFTLALAVLCGVFVGGWSVGLWQKVRDRLTERRLQAPFGEMLAREVARLDRLYPASSSARWSRDRTFAAS